MKKTIIFLFLMTLLTIGGRAQSCYWVMLTDKAGTTFDPYSYFDAKAIERYQLNGADLYDSSNFPLNNSYVQQVANLATEDFGQSRWLNAVAVTATPKQIAAIQQLACVKEVVPLESHTQLSQFASSNLSELEMQTAIDSLCLLSKQLVRMGGQCFRAKGINGKGVRVAVFDGGFPQVNTHIAFKHLRDEGRIVKTWNFPNKKENVYGWNSHGTMTLSCIAGIYQAKGEEAQDLGLATGAEFLLARTEVNTEPFKEEVWWQMAVEWADKNGAQIISSSLGYGKDRYYTKDMDGTSYVAKAGNMAARKGMLVCNSAGNEGTDATWRTIITPSDADSVLCVGGIVNSLTTYDHISFSSYGPSADGRQKPNVVAFGHAYTANTGKSDDAYHYVDGTSFSCPLVAGFAACAMQAKPGLKAMELFHEIEKSADLYPYCDYTYGYGVPQAYYFTGDRKKAEPTFHIVKDSTTGMVQIVPLQDNNECSYLFVKHSNRDGQIIEYQKHELDKWTTDMRFELSGSHIVTVQYNGYAESYDFGAANKELSLDLHNSNVEYNPQDNRNYLNEKKSRHEFYIMTGLPVGLQQEELDHNIKSPAKRIGWRRTFHFTKAYGWGYAIEYGNTSFRFDDKANQLDTLIAMDGHVTALDKEVAKHRVNLGEVGIEIYQRVRFLPAGMLHKGLHWDLGVYGSWGFNAYKLKGSSLVDFATTRKEVLRNIDPLSEYQWNWGITTRLTYNIIGVYARFRLNGIGSGDRLNLWNTAPQKVNLPRLEAGLQYR